MVYVLIGRAPFASTSSLFSIHNSYIYIPFFLAPQRQKRTGSYRASKTNRSKDNRKGNDLRHVLLTDTQPYGRADPEASS
jgi:hypothetical protein